MELALSSEQWAEINNFTKSEFTCNCCGKEKMRLSYMRRLDRLREEYGKALTPSSGYRCPEHNKNVGGSSTSYHVKGRAVDFPLRDSDAYDLANLAFKHGFKGIGIDQRGDDRFLHFDDRPYSDRRLFTY